MQPILKTYLEYFESISPETVTRLREIAVSDLHFVDPFNDVRDLEQVIKIFMHMYKLLDQPRFKITDVVCEGNRMFVRWDFYFKTRLLSGGPEHHVDGVSLVRCNDSGKITEHIDFWDATSQVLMKIRVIGLPLRLLARLGQP